MRTKYIGLFLLACVSGLLTIPALSFGQQRGGDPTQQGARNAKKGIGGQGGGKGQINISGTNLDVNALFEQISQGKDSLLISNSGPLMVPLQQWARDNGNTSGVISRQQFSGFIQGYVSGLQAGGAGKGAKGKGADADAAAAQRFKGVDKNGDGFISIDEMSAQARETGVWKTFDVNGDARLNLEEYKNFSREKAAAELALKLAGGAKGTAGLYAAMVESKVVNTEMAVKVDWGKLPVVFRPGKLPANIPPWFVQLDVDRDAQVGLYEWKNSQKTYVEFQLMDRNNDSLVTADEVLWHMKAVATLDGPAMTPAAYAQALQGMQGVQNGGVGGFNNKGKGGGTKGGFGGGFGGAGGGGGSNKGKKGGGNW